MSPALVGGFLSTVHQGSPGSLTDNTELIRILYEYVTHVFPMREENVIKKIIRKIKYIYSAMPCFQASRVALVVKNMPANAGDVRDAGPIPGSGRSPGGGHGNQLQYSCPENPMDRAAWQATVQRVAQSLKQLK